jgi:hypothetical protein
MPIVYTYLGVLNYEVGSKNVFAGLLDLKFSQR